MKQKPKAQKDTSIADKISPSLGIVGIGASSGGLEAFFHFFKALPPTTGFAYVIISHLDPTYKSRLAEILSSKTTMPVIEAHEGSKVLPNHVYVIPPNTAITISKGALQLTDRITTDGQHLAVDHFFTSLAQDQGKNAFGIILSGAAADGSRGIKAIKEAGGITFAQTEETAQFPSMPHFAISTNCIDFILSPDNLAKKLAEISAQLSTNHKHDKKLDNISDVFLLLHTKKNIDFSRYKMDTIKRRLKRRMLLNQINDYTKYVHFVEKNPEELDALYQDLLIGVTEFFRDPEKFEQLKTELFPKLVQKIVDDKPIRIWIAGCSTGEEAYSMAISLLEYMEDTNTIIPIQILASDVNEKAIDVARQGVYPSRISSYVSSERIKKYFVKEGNTYQINKQIRNMCIFAVHNIIKDPPFSQMNLITCCNVLIYMDQVLQKKILSTFHYALKQGGYLMLGKSETIGASELFSALDKKNKFYAKNSTNSRIHFDYSPTNLPKGITNKIKSYNKKNIFEPDIHEEVTALLVSKYAPASIVVSDSMEILEFQGPTGRYIQHKGGQASLNLLKMSPQNLLLELRALIHQAKKENQPVRKNDLWTEIDRQNRTFGVEVVPLKNTSPPSFLITFEENLPADSTSAKKSSLSTLPEVSKNDYITKLETELKDIRKYLHAVIEEHDNTNEEQKALNEEILSSNEELQSINEETSKEEIESTNEELLTVNEELQNTNQQLKEARDYSERIVETVIEPLMVLDRSLRITSANTSFYDTFHVEREHTVGTLIYELGNGQWNIPELREALEQILPQNKQFLNFEITHAFPKIGKRTMLLNARQLDHQQQILLAIEDITEKKLFQEHKNNQQRKNLKRRKESEERKDEFMSIASHELKTPISSIKAYAQIIQSRLSTDADDTSRGFLSKMDEQLNNLTKLVDDLLDVSKIQSGKLQIKKEESDFDTSIRNVVSDMQKIIRTHTISLEGGITRPVFMDVYRMQQVLINLITNAVKYSPQADRVRIAMETDTDKVTVSVQDFGIGIAKDELKKVFAPYYRVSSKHAAKFPGLGLGLRIAKEIVEQHGGKMWVKSKYGEGSTFFYSLPIK